MQGKRAQKLEAAWIQEQFDSGPATALETEFLIGLQVIRTLEKDKIDLYKRINRLQRELDIANLLKQTFVAKYQALAGSSKYKTLTRIQTLWMRAILRVVIYTKLHKWYKLWQPFTLNQIYVPASAMKTVWQSNSSFDNGTECRPVRYTIEHMDPTGACTYATKISENERFKIMQNTNCIGPWDANRFNLAMSDVGRWLRAHNPYRFTSRR